MSARVKAAEVLSWTEGTLLTGSGEEFFQGISTDSRAIGPGMLFVALRGETDGHWFVAKAVEQGASGVLVEQGFDASGLSASAIEVKDTTLALGRIAKGIRMGREDLKVAAITGSAGKTTTKELTAAVARAVHGDKVLVTEGNYNNHIGVPWTLFRLEESHTHAVVEMGMNHPGEIRYLADIARPQVAVITNVLPVHLEFMKTVEAIAKAKGEILENLGADDTAVLNADDERVLALGASGQFSKITFGKNPKADVRAVLTRNLGPEGTEVDTSFFGETVRFRLQLLGVHNVSNALAAIAVGTAWNIPLEKMIQAVESVRPAERRTRVVNLKSGAKAIDDVYNANPASMELALGMLEGMAVGGRRVAVLGDMFELGDFAVEGHRQVGRAAAKAGLARLVAMGDHAGDVLQAAREEGFDENNCHLASDYEQAAQLAKKDLGPGDWVLVKGSRGMAMERVLEGLLRD